MEAPSSIFWGVVLVSVLVGVNAFFVAAEYALVRVRRTQMEALAAQGSRAATVVLHGLDHLSRYIAGVQVGITLAGLASGLFGEPALAALIDPVAALLFPPSLLGQDASNALSTGLTLLVITYLLVVLGELVPKAHHAAIPGPHCPLCGQADATGRLGVYAGGLEYERARQSPPAPAKIATARRRPGDVFRRRIAAPHYTKSSSGHSWKTSSGK